MEQAELKKFITFWLDKSAEDLATAKSLLENNQFNWCAFICQQALEKCLKAGYIKQIRATPPYIHKLERLVSVLSLEPPEEILNAIIEIDKYYIVTRYPTYKEEININDVTSAKLIYKKTEACYKWLMQELRL